MDADEADEPSDLVGTAAPVTRAIATRVRELRKQARLSGPALAARLNELGINWTRTTVAKFETFQRQSLTVQELLALALALEVTPVFLIADPRAEGSVPLTADFEVDQWAALAWLVGAASVDPAKRRLEYRGMNKQGGDPAWIVSNALWLALAISDIDVLRGPGALPGPMPGGGVDGVEDEERKAFEAVRQVVRRIVLGGGLKPPRLDESLRSRAAELGIDLSVEPLDEISS